MKFQKTPFASCLSDVLDGLDETQAAFAKRSRVSTTHLSSYKTGATPVPGAEVVERIVSAVEDDGLAARLVRSWILTVAPEVSRRVWVGERAVSVVREGSSMAEEMVEAFELLTKTDQVALVGLARMMSQRPLVGEAVRATLSAFAPAGNE
jgi:predicted transcriptional regulator